MNGFCFLLPSGTVNILYGNKIAFLVLKIKALSNTVLCFYINYSESVFVLFCFAFLAKDFIVLRISSLAFLVLC